MTHNSKKNFFETGESATLLEQMEILSVHLCRPIVVLDLGGNPQWWSGIGGLSCIEHVRIRTMAPLKYIIKDSRFQYEHGDVTDFSAYDDKSIDMVVSTSVVEWLWEFPHLQKQFASECQRIARSGWVHVPKQFDRRQAKDLFKGCYIERQRKFVFFLDHWVARWFPKTHFAASDTSIWDYQSRDMMPDGMGK